MPEFTPITATSEMEPIKPEEAEIKLDAADDTAPAEETEVGTNTPSYPPHLQANK